MRQIAPHVPAALLVAVDIIRAPPTIVVAHRAQHRHASTPPKYFFSYYRRKDPKLESGGNAYGIPTETGCLTPVRTDADAITQDSDAAAPSARALLDPDQEQAPEHSPGRLSSDRRSSHEPGADLDGDRPG
jgi:hypothetical protein